MPCGLPIISCNVSAADLEIQNNAAINLAQQEVQATVDWATFLHLTNRQEVIVCRNNVATSGQGERKTGWLKTQRYVPHNFFVIFQQQTSNFGSWHNVLANKLDLTGSSSNSWLVNNSLSNKQAWSYFLFLFFIYY